MGTPIKNKILNIDALADTLSTCREERRKVAHCHGVFDPMHIGHIRHFQQAKGMGDILIVTVTPDRYVNKGPHRPVFTESLRAEAIASIDCVDFVAINKWPTAVDTIELLKPDVFVKGSEFTDLDSDRTGAVAREAAAVESYGGKMGFTNDITFSSSRLVNRHLRVFSESVSNFLTEFTSRHDSDEVLGYLNNARDLKVLLIGEAIIDEYRYCEAMGKSGKEPVLAALYMHTEHSAGGVLAAANHVAQFCDRVDVLTYIGEIDSHEEFIRRNLAPNVTPIFQVVPDVPTIVKTRYVQHYPLQKLFEIYRMGDLEKIHIMGDDICQRIEPTLPEYDVVIVTDYDHGMLGPRVIEALRNARFLAVNTQVNAGNHGFNTVSKYPNADFICVSEGELRLEARNRTQPVKELVRDVAHRLTCDRFIVTQGEMGCLCYDQAAGFFRTPAFTTHIVDRVGAGDALFSIASLCVAQDVPLDVVGFIGNAVGAQAVTIVANRTSIERQALCRYIEHLMK